ncbi:2-oxoacid:acceptor oxidoreductase subunit alpha [Candidatus Micrarchaeota archaeon]|nr:2-oxoacid:acceptor oxidoreductase subunit alpha [Candidatus Micrarchaeota archaeon]
MEFICKIAGQAGAGVMTTSRLMVKCFTRGGYNAVGYPEYPSLIRGGHNTVQVRISDKPVNTPLAHQELVIALNKDAVFYHMSTMSSGGAIIYDQMIDISKFSVRSDVKMYALPLAKLTADAGGTEQMKNTAALGAALGMIDYPFEILEQLMSDELAHKGPEVIKKNVGAARAGYDYVKSNSFPFEKKVKPISVGKKNIVITGNEAIALGSIKAGCKFYAAYPMTPASTILHAMIDNEKRFKLVVKQTEDEIAAINYAIGASFAGARSMVGTSGGGFALMAEALGFAAIAEVPIVIALAQRSGPSTGMPTWTEQGDLRFALHASQGDFPRVVLAPGDMQECFFLSALSHNLSGKYQVPVIILSDKFLSETVFSTAPFDHSKVKIEAGKIKSNLPALAPMARYKRYALSADGVSDRVLPGEPFGTHVATSYEHDETGFSSESFHMRVHQVQKRAKKLETLKHELPPPLIYGPKDAPISLVCWGSTKLTLIDALPLLENAGIKANIIHFTTVFPLHQADLEKLFKNTKTKIMVEANSSAQFAGVIRECSGIEMDFHFLKYDGRPFYPEQLLEQLQKLKAAGFKGNKEVIFVEKEDLEYFNPTRHGL